MSQDSATPAFAGSYTALITPFSNGRVDEDAFRKLVEFQIESGTHGLVPVGTTGESPTLSHDEHDRVIELCIEQAAGRVPVIAGAGSNATAEAVRLARHAADAGADGVLIVSPITTSRRRKGCTAISRPSPRLSTSPSSSMTFPAARSSGSTMPISFA